MKKLSKLFLTMVLTSSLQAAELTTFIYNGTTTTSIDWPYMAALYYDTTDYGGNNEEQVCGATLLDNQYVLTAAHCLYNGGSEPSQLVMTFMKVAYQMSSLSEYDSGALKIWPSEFYVHEDFVNSATSEDVAYPNDIAIIKLSEAISYDDFVSLASTTNASSYAVDDEEFIAVGFGETENSDGDELLQTTLNYVPIEECTMSAGDSQLCMSGEYSEETEVRNSTCSGDSGGPLFWYDDDTSSYVQTGISSYGWSNCYEPTTDNTSVFTEIADYQDWIDSVQNGEIDPIFTVTDNDRYEYVYGSTSDEEESNTSNLSSTSSSSGGSLSIGVLIVLGLGGVLRMRETYGRKTY